MAFCYGPPKFRGNLQPLTEGNLAILGPRDIPQDTLRDLRLNHAIPKKIGDVRETCLVALTTTASCIGHAAVQSDEVSETADVGIQGPVFASGVYFCRFRGDTMALANCKTVEELDRFRFPVQL